MQPTCIHCLTTHTSVWFTGFRTQPVGHSSDSLSPTAVIGGAWSQSPECYYYYYFFNLGRSSRGGRQKLILEIIALMVSHPSGSYYYYYYLAHQHKAAGRKTRLDIQNYGLQRQFTLLLWCCGKKPHFLFAEPWKGIGKLLLLLLYVLNADSAGRPMN